MFEKLLSVISRALVPIIVLVVFALARRFMSAAAESPVKGVSPDDLTARFKSTRWIFGMSMAVVGLLFALSTHAVLILLNRGYSSLQVGPGLTLSPQTAIWWFFPGFGALTLCYELTLQLWAAVGSQREVALYDFWTSYKAGFACRKMLRWMSLVIVLPIGLLTAMALPMHATLGQDEIVDCGYGFSPCRHYRYSDARRLTEIEGFRDRTGKLIDRAGIVIDFSDGRRWSSAEWGDFSRSVDPELVAFFKAKTKLQMESVVSESDIDTSQ